MLPAKFAALLFGRLGRELLLGNPASVMRLRIDIEGTQDEC